MNSNRPLAFVLALILICASALSSKSAEAQIVTYNARAAISAASSGNNIVIAGVAGKRIYIFGIDLSTASSTTVQFKDGTTALTGIMTLNAYSKGLLVSSPAYWVLTAGNDFVISLGGAVQMSGAVWYAIQ